MSYFTNLLKTITIPNETQNQKRKSENRCKWRRTDCRYVENEMLKCSARTTSVSIPEMITWWIEINWAGPALSTCVHIVRILRHIYFISNMIPWPCMRFRHLSFFSPRHLFICFCSESLSVSRGPESISYDLMGEKHFIVALNSLMSFIGLFDQRIGATIDQLENEKKTKNEIHLATLWWIKFIEYSAKTFFDHLAWPALLWKLTHTIARQLCILHAINYSHWPVKAFRYAGVTFLLSPGWRSKSMTFISDYRV